MSSCEVSRAALVQVLSWLQTLVCYHLSSQMCSLLPRLDSLLLVSGTFDGHPAPFFSSYCLLDWNTLPFLFCPPLLTSWLEPTLTSSSPALLQLSLPAGVSPVHATSSPSVDHLCIHIYTLHKWTTMWTP